jgi:hypothetical protein
MLAQAAGHEGRDLGVVFHHENAHIH